MGKKILFIGLGKSYGGVEQFLYEVCTSELKEEYDFEFLSYYEIDEKTRNMLLDLGINSLYRVSRYSENPFCFIKDISQFYKKHNEYDYIYCNASHASVILYSFPVWRKRKFKIIFHSHASDGNHRGLQFLLRKIVNKVCVLKIACSEDAAQWMYGNSKDIYIIHNGVETNRFRFEKGVREEMRMKYHVQDKMVYGHVGRFSEVKNHMFLLAVFEEILCRQANAYLLLIGEGELHGEIEKEICKRGLQDKVLIIPFKEQIQDYYQMMDVFILPSLREAFPLTGIEAQACGLPTFFSDGVPKEVKLTDLVRFISLEESAVRWAEKILERKLENNREIYCEKVFLTGCDKKKVCENIRNLLRKV